MNKHYAEARKITPGLKPDGTPNDQNRIEIGPTDLAFAEWAALGLEMPNLTAMREYRHKRLVEQINLRGYGAALVFDPLNIRYATDTTNMQLWNMHNPFRAVMVCADGYMVIWDYKNAPFLSDFNPLVREVRSGASMFYFNNGDRGTQRAAAFVADFEDLVKEHCGGNKRIAVDKIMVEGYRAMVAAGYEVEEGEELMEKTRSIKGPDEILAMRCSSAGCEAAITIMEDNTFPGMTEDDIWAIMHAENIKRGGEWIETRLLATGQRTNPWFQECGPRILQNNEIVSYDTDLVGAYGICTDISRSYWVGDQKPRADMIDAMLHGIEHIETNMAMLGPGVPFSKITHEGHKLRPEFDAQKYGCMMHGVGLCDEWPLIAYPDKWEAGSFDYEFEPGMCVCVEALVGTVGGDFSIKLEDQVLITEDGYENLTQMRFCPHLTGRA